MKSVSYFTNAVFEHNAQVTDASNNRASIKLFKGQYFTLNYRCTRNLVITWWCISSCPSPLLSFLLHISFPPRPCLQGPCSSYQRGPPWRRITGQQLFSTPACSTTSRLWPACICSNRPSSPQVSLCNPLHLLRLGQNPYTLSLVPKRMIRACLESKFYFISLEPEMQD